MAVSTKHAFNSAVADGSDPTEVQPSNWNAEHVITGTANALPKLTGTALVESSLTDSGTSVQCTHAAVCPFDIRGSVTNTWDLSPMIAANTDPATIRVFGQTVTTTPSVEQSLTLAITPGTGGAGGVYLRPNGPSFFDPDSFARKSKILAIGFTVPDYELDVRDAGNAHIFSELTFGSLRVINAAGTGTFDTTGGACDNRAVDAEALGSRSAGSNALTNYGVYCSAANAPTNNYALFTDQGDVRLNNTNGTTTVNGNATFLKPSTFSAQADFNAGSLYNAGFGNAGGAGNVYIVSGTINGQYSSNANDHLDLNWFGYQGGTTQFRDLNIRDGQGGIIASFTGSSKTTALQGLLNMNSHRINSVTDPSAAQDAATKNYVDTRLGSGGTESLSASGAASVAVITTFASGTGTNLTLANGSVDGQVHVVVATAGTGQITPAAFGNGTKMTWSAGSQSCTLVWGATSAKWWLTSNVGMTVV